MSVAKTVGERHLEVASSIVNKPLEIIEYFQPQIWWLETPRHGLLAKMDVMASL